MRFWELYQILQKRRWMVGGLVVATLFAIYIGTLNEKQYYKASVQIMPSHTALYRPMMPSALQQAVEAVGEHKTSNQLPNIMSLLKSRELAARTLATAGISGDPDSLISRIDVNTVANPGARSHDDLGTDLIEVTVRDGDPEHAVRTVNCLAHVFANFYQELSHQEAADNRRFLESELVRTKRIMEDQAEKLQQFKMANSITGAESASDSALAGYRQAALDRDAAQAALAESQAKLSQIDRQLRRTGPTRTVMEGTSNTPMLQQLEEQHAGLVKQLNDARARYEDAHPQVVGLKESIEEVQAKIKAERGKISTNVSVVRNPVYESLLQERAKLAYERDGLAARARQLSAAAARSSAELRPGADVTLVRLENDFKNAQATYNNLQNQLNQVRISEKETTATGAMRIVDEAARAKGPLGVNKIAYLVMGGLLSLMVGTGIAVTMESLDNRIKTNADVEKLFGLSPTALIPKSEAPSDSRLARITYTDPLSPISEAYRFLRTDLLLSTQDTDVKSIMVATAKPGQGGTVTLANLGISLAMDGKRVILVDADMRRPCLHRIFKASNEFGLSNVLAGEMEFHESVLHTEVDNLFLIPGGPTPSNPSELLGSHRMRALVEWLSDQSDYVLLDTPAAVAFTDAVVLSRVVDGVILVVRAQQVPRGAEEQVKSMLAKANANILGVVLNDVEPENVDSYYYHSHYYPHMWSKRLKLSDSFASGRSLPPVNGQD